MVNFKALTSLVRAPMFRAGYGPKIDKKISGLIRAWDILFVLGAQKYDQNNLATLLNFSGLTYLSCFFGMIWASN